MKNIITDEPLTWNWIDEILEILRDDELEEVGAFAENSDLALNLPIDDDMFWVITVYENTTLHMVNYPIHVKLRHYNRSMAAVSNGRDLTEAICKTWLQWKRGLQS